MTRRRRAPKTAATGVGLLPFPRVPHLFGYASMMRRCVTPALAAVEQSGSREAVSRTPGKVSWIWAKVGRRAGSWCQQDCGGESQGVGGLFTCGLRMPPS